MFLTDRGVQAKIVRDAKQQGEEDVFVSARTHVDHSIRQHTAPANMHQLHGNLNYDR